MVTEGLSRDTAIAARAPDEAKVTAMMTAAWRVGSVLISNANFMPKNIGKRGIYSFLLEIGIPYFYLDQVQIK